jgi:uncharacterized surface protein with fasciclin (FAS1) repeats
MRATLALIFGLLAAVVVVSLPLRAQDRTPTIAGLIAASDDYDTLRRLLNVAPDVAALLDDRDAEITFYAPTDAAFNRLFSDSLLTVEWYLRRPNRTDELLRRHIAPAALDAGALEFLPCRALGTMLPEHWLLLDRDGDDLTVNMQAVDAPAEPAANGLLVPINSVFPRIRLYPAASNHAPAASGGEADDPRWEAPKSPHAADGSIRDVLAADGRFGHWLALLDAEPELAARLDNAGIYTLFLPTDTALDSQLEADGLDIAGFAEANPAFAAGSVVPGYFTPDILIDDITFNAPAFCTLQPDDVLRTTQTGGVARVAGLPLTGDILYAENAIIYVLNGVREPAFQG